MELLKGSDATYVYDPETEQEVLTEAEYAAMQEKSVGGLFEEYAPEVTTAVG